MQTQLHKSCVWMQLIFSRACRIHHAVKVSQWVINIKDALFEMTHTSETELACSLGGRYYPERRHNFHEADCEWLNERFLNETQAFFRAD